MTDPQSKYWALFMQDSVASKHIIITKHEIFKDILGGAGKTTYILSARFRFIANLS
jgi:hypothetical protein